MSEKNFVLDLSTTVGLTRYLRSKDISVDQICKISSELLNNSTSLYLPQKEKFILELLCDRVSQVNNLSHSCKISSKFWSLFNSLWETCGNDQRLSTIRNKITNIIRFGDILTQTFDAINGENIFSDVELIATLSTSINYLLDDSKLVLSQDQNITILKYLLNCVAACSFTIELDHIILNLVYSIFKLNNTNSLKYDKKHIIEFSSFCLPSLLICIEKYPNNSKNLESMIFQVLYKKEHLPNITENIEYFLKSSIQYKLFSKELVYLLKITISRIDIVELEIIFKNFIAAYPAYSADFLKEITLMNKTLSTEFVSSLVRNTLEKPDGNLNVITEACKRNSEVGIKFSEDIFRICSTSNNHIDLLKSIFDCYVKSREIPQFVNLWSKFVQKANTKSSICSDEFVDYCSLKIATLSYAQLSQLVKELVNEYKENEDINPISLVSVANGLLNGVTGSVQNALSRTLILNLHRLKPELQTLLNVKGKFSWRLKFYIFTLFDLEDLGEFSFQSLLDLKPVPDEFYYFTILRILEQDVNLLTDNLTENFVKFYKKASLSFKTVIFQRWFMLLEALLNKEQMDTIIKSLLCSTNEEVLCNIFSNHMIQDQNLLMDSFIDNCLSNDKYVKHLNSISAYAYKKQQRISVLNSLLRQSNTLYAKQLILKLLALPTYKSDLETKLDSLFFLVAANVKESDNNALVIVDVVFDIHLKRISESGDYLENAFNELINRISNLKIKKGVFKTEALNVALSLLNKSMSIKNVELLFRRNELSSIFISKSLDLLGSRNTKLSERDVCILLKDLSIIQSDEGISYPILKIKEIIKNIGQNYKESRIVKNFLFTYVCALKKAYSPEYILALYVTLNDVKNYSSIENYIKTLESYQGEEIFYALWENTTSSLLEAKENDLDMFISITSCFIDSVIKSSDECKLKLAQHLFVVSISKISLLTVKQSDNYINSLTKLLDSIKLSASNKNWIFTQYSVEMILAFICQISNCLQNSDKSFNEFYTTLTQTVSSIILYQRFRLSNRHHLLILVFISLMKLLFVKSVDLKSKSGLAFERLVGNLCEPNINKISIQHISNNDISFKDASINNELAQVKLNLRKSLPVLLFNYLKFYLQYQVNLEVKKHLDVSIYIVLDLFTLNELSYINKSLDNQSRSVFKNLYEDYKKFYRWKEE